MTYQVPIFAILPPLCGHAGPGTARRASTVNPASAGNLQASAFPVSRAILKSGSTSYYISHDCVFARTNHESDPTGGLTDAPARSIRLGIVLRRSARMRVEKWGDSLAIRLPDAVVNTLGLQEGDEVEVQITRPRTSDVDRDLTREHASREFARSAGSFRQIGNSTATTPTRARLHRGEDMPAPVHPGRLWRRELKARELSANCLALDLGVPSRRITGILNERRVDHRGYRASARPLFRQPPAILARSAKPIGPRRRRAPCFIP